MKLKISKNGKADEKRIKSFLSDAFLCLQWIKDPLYCSTSIAV